MDNLRRSLFPAALLGLFLLGWMGLPDPAFWTLVGLATIFIPPILETLVEFFRKPKDHSVPIHMQTFGRRMLYRLTRLIFTVAFLPFDAINSMDAIGRTLFRVLITRRHLLQWQTADDVKGRLRHDLAGFYAAMFFGPLLATLMAVVLIYARPMALVAAGAPLILWLASPAIAWWISKPLRIREVHITPEQQHLLRGTARRIWWFFETFMGPEDNYLPPDNYQEYPMEVTAHRTSPTNIGLGLASVLAAYDFGYICAGELAQRLEKTFQTLHKMERYHGHFYNWYDTVTLKPLLPNYVSTVDSGNLAGFLLIVRQGLLEVPENPILSSRAFSGLGDMILIVLDLLDKKLRKRSGSEKTLAYFRQIFTEVMNAPHTLRAACLMLDRITKSSEEMVRTVSSDADEEWRWACNALARQCRCFYDELTELAPWAMTPPPVDDFRRNGLPHQHEILAET